MRTGTLGTAVGVSFTYHIFFLKALKKNNNKNKNKKHYPVRKSLLYEAELKVDFI